MPACGCLLGKLVISWVTFRGKMGKSSIWNTVEVGEDSLSCRDLDLPSSPNSSSPTSSWIYQVLYSQWIIYALGLPAICLPWFCLHALHTSSLLVVAFERLKDSFNIYSVIPLACLNIALQNEIRALPHSATSSLHNHYLLPGIFCTLPPFLLRLLYSLLVVSFLGRGRKLPTSTRSNLGWPFIMFKKLNQCSTRGFHRAFLILATHTTFLVWQQLASAEE